MPVFEYKCSVCENKFEYFHKSATIQAEVCCPICNSNKNQKLFSLFNSSMKNESKFSSADCTNGNCSLPAVNCSSGMCNLN